MSTTIDQKVVEMRFDNKNFESNIKNTMSTLEKFKQKLNLTGASKGLENVGEAANKIKFNGLSNAVETVRARFSALEVMGVTALANITNSAVNAGKRIVSALTIDPIKTGFSEYETQIGAVQTILANTESKGTTLQDVNSALDTLNTYADKTIYNFTEMTRNIGTFTAAGIDLKNSVSSIQGIANLAAVSGSTSQQASVAMYQLSQALSSGTVKLMDWNSVVNAGMGGQVFQDALKRTATVMGKNVDAIIKKHGSFRESLQEGWITADVLTETLNQFTMAAEEGTAEWNNYLKALKEKGYTEEQAKSILKMANTATEAATKVKTFTQLWDTLKESAQSGWTQSWEIMVGDFEEAKSFLTRISDTVGKMLGDSAEARNKLLSGGLTTGWKQLLGAGIADEEGFKETLNSVAKSAKVSIEEIQKSLGDDATFEDALAEGFKQGKLNADMFTESVHKMAKKMSEMSAEELKAAGYTVEHVAQIQKLSDGLKDGSVSMDEFVKKMTRPSGRENIIDALWNSFDAVLAIIKPIKEAFRDIFPRMTGEQLYEITKNIKDFSEKLKISEKTAEKLKQTFKGLFSIIDIGVTFVKELTSGIIKLVSNFIGVPGYILGATGSLGDWISGVRDSIKESNIFGKTIEGIVGFLQKAIDTIKEFTKEVLKIESFTNIFKALFDFISQIGSKIGKAISSAFNVENIQAGMAIFNGGIFSAILLGVNKFVKSLSGVMDNAKGFMGNLKDILGGVKDALKAYQEDLKANVLLKIAKAVGILAASLIVLAMVDPERLGSAMTGISVLFAELFIALGTFGKIAPDITRVFKAATAMTAIASSMFILSLAIKILSTIEWKQMGVALLGLAGGLGAMIGAIWALPEKDLIKTTNAMKKMASSLLVLSLAIKILSTIELKEMGVALLGLAGGLGAMIGAMWALPKSGGIGKASGMFVLATSMVVLAGALKILATMNWDAIRRSLTAMGGALSELIIAINLMPKQSGTKSLAMLGMVTSMVVLAGALKILATMNWDAIGRSLTAMGGALLELIVMLGAMKLFKMESTALPLLAIASALIPLALSLKLLGSMSLGSICKGLLALGGAFVVIGGAAAILAPLGGVLLSIAGAVAIFGVASLAIGAGLTLMATGITALSVALATGVTSIVGGITAIILGIIGLVPEIVKVIGNSIKLICEVIMESAPLIAKTVLVVVYEVLNSLAEFTPKIVDALFRFIVGTINELKKHIPAFVTAAFDFLKVFFSSIADVIGSVNADQLRSCIESLGMFAGLIVVLKIIAGMIPGAMIGVLGMGVIIAELALVFAAIGLLTKLPGLTTMIEQGGNLILQIVNILGSILQIIAQTIQPFIPIIVQIITTLSDVIIKGFTAVFQAITPILNILANIILGTIKVIGDVIVGLIQAIAPHLPSITEMITSLITVIKDALAGLLNAIAPIAQTIADLILGVVQALAPHIPAITTMITSIVAIIADAITKIIEVTAPFIPNLHSIVNAVVEGVKAIVDGFIALVEQISPVIDSISNLVRELGDAISEVFDSISGIVNSVGDSIKNVLDGIAGVIESIGKSAYLAGTGFENMANGIKMITDLNLVDMVASLGAVAKGLSEISKHSDGLAKAGKGMEQIANGTTLSANSFGVISSNIDRILSSFKMLGPAATNTMRMVQGAVTSAAPQIIKASTLFINVGRTIIDSLVKGIIAGKNAIIIALNSMINTSVTAIRMYESSFYLSGKFLVEGFARGISSHRYLATAKAREMAKAAEKAAKKELKINSPSKKFMKIGSAIPEGFAKGIGTFGSAIKKSVSEMGGTAIDKTKSVLSRVGNIVSDLDGLDGQPTIRPVLDLSDVESGIGHMNGMFDNGPSIGVSANLRSISLGMNRKIQNGVNDDVVTAIDKLRKDLGNIGSNTYTINGITYGGEGDIANAVQTLVRAVTIEGRV